METSYKIVVNETEKQVEEIASQSTNYVTITL